MKHCYVAIVVLLLVDGCASFQRGTVVGIHNRHRRFSRADATSLSTSNDRQRSFATASVRSIERSSRSSDSSPRVVFADGLARRVESIGRRVRALRRQRRRPRWSSLLSLLLLAWTWTSFSSSALASTLSTLEATPLPSAVKAAVSTVPVPPPPVVAVASPLGSFRLLPSAAELECTFRMAFAGACGAAVGAERNSSETPAGVRTMALVALGACCFTLCSVHGFAGLAGRPVDPSRMASNVASGVGFIGAGVITNNGNGSGDDDCDSRNRSGVNGLATAAAIWVAAAAGVSSGVGLYFVSAAATAGTIAVLKYGKLAGHHDQDHDDDEADFVANTATPRVVSSSSSSNSSNSKSSPRRRRIEFHKEQTLPLSSNNDDDKRADDDFFKESDTGIAMANRIATSVLQNASDSDMAAPLVDSNLMDNVNEVDSPPQRSSNGTEAVYVASPRILIEDDSALP